MSCLYCSGWIKQFGREGKQISFCSKLVCTKNWAGQEPFLGYASQLSLCFLKLCIFSKTDFTFDQLQVCKTAREFCFVFTLHADELVQICFHVTMGGGAVPPGRQWHGIAYSLTGSGNPLLWLPSLGMQSHKKEWSEIAHVSCDFNWMELILTRLGRLTEILRLTLDSRLRCWATSWKSSLLAREWILGI